MGVEDCIVAAIGDILPTRHSYYTGMTISTDHSTTQELDNVGALLRDHPARLQALLDGAFLAAALATFGQIWDPDVLFHVIWVILTLQAFLFGLRYSVFRVVIAGVLLLTYFNLGALDEPGGAEFADLDLAEWPLMIAIAVIVAVMADRLSTTSRHYADLYRRASDRLLTAQEVERKRLGQDLHDGVGQTLTAMVLTLDAAESQLWAGKNPPSTLARSNIVRAQELAAIALEETRDVSYRLRPDRLVETGLVAATSRMASNAGVPVTVSAPERLRVPNLLEPEDEMSVYRIVQEALANAVRYASARSIRIEFRSVGDRLLVTIVDDGVGFIQKDARRLGLGLAGMEERAIVLGSPLSISSRPGRGTRISASAALRAAKGAEPRVTARPIAPDPAR
jgi:signal transduction histidine kinase